MVFSSPLAPSDFLSVQLGDLVVVTEDVSNIDEELIGWWLGHVIHIYGGARDPLQNSLFQVVDVDTGLIKTINADLVKAILVPKDLS